MLYYGLLIQYPTHYGMQVPLYEYIAMYIVCFMVGTYMKSQIPLAEKLRSGGDTLCYSWFKIIFD